MDVNLSLNVDYFDFAFCLLGLGLGVYFYKVFSYGNESDAAIKLVNEVSGKISGNLQKFASKISDSSPSSSSKSCVADDKVSTESIEMIKHPLDFKVIPNRILDIEYAVRGMVPIRAKEIEGEMEADPSKYPFDKLIFCNIGNPLQVGLKPVTFVRQVLSCYWAKLQQSDAKFPSDVEKLVDSIISKHKIGAYSESRGMKVIQDICLKWINKRDNLNVQSQCFITNGASTGINSLFELFMDSETAAEVDCFNLEAANVNNSVNSILSNQNDKTHFAPLKNGVFLPIPQYPLYSATIVKLGGEVIPYYLKEAEEWAIPSDAELEKLYMDSLKNGVHPKSLVIINPGNPTGSLASREDLIRLLKFSEKRKLVVFADEVYQDNIWTVNESFHSCREIMYTEKIDITCASFHSTSKGFYGECGVRGGLMVLENVPTDSLAVLDKLVSVGLCSNVSGQMAMAALCSLPEEGDESYPQFIKEKTETLVSMKEKAEYLYKEFNTIENVKCNMPKGALYLFPNITMTKNVIKKAAAAGLKPDVYYCIKMLESTGIVCVPGSGFKQEPGTFHFRITILPQLNDLIKGMKAFKEFHARILSEE